jgi:hypothetical protein
MANEALQGLNCPRCGGIVPVPEGQAIVICPYCDLRSLVSSGSGPGEEAAAQASEGVITRRGVLRYQAPLRVERAQAEAAMRKFLTGKFQVARDAAKTAEVSEVFLVHLPFWAVWGRGLAYVFGQEQVGSGDKKRWEPREKKVVKEMTWNMPACEVGEFGVRKIKLEGCPLEPFVPAALHRTGMVFEPVGSARSALEVAQNSFHDEIRNSVKMERVNQFFTRLIRPRLALVYYPLWVVRYNYHGRSFQVAVDAVNGEILYGKAPGSVAYRAGVLVGGMALGSVLAVDVSVLLLMIGDEDSEGLFVGALGAFVLGLGMLYGAYRTFRHGEHYEYHRFGKEDGGGIAALGQLNNIKEVRDITRQMEKLS